MSDRWINAVIDLTIALDISPGASFEDKQAAVAAKMAEISEALPEQIRNNCVMGGYAEEVSGGGQ